MPQEIKTPSASVETNATRTASDTEAIVTPPQITSVSTNSFSRVDEQKDNTTQVTSDQVNTTAGTEKAPEEKPARKGPLSVEELQEKRRMGLLTIDEAKQLNDAENAPSDATVKQLPDNDRAIKDPDKNKFEEGDVIAYMYKKWLIEGVMWVDQKVRKYGLYGLERLASAVSQRRAEQKAINEKIKNSSTNKSAEKIQNLQKEREEKIVAQSKEKADDIFRISQVIQAGTLFDPKNKELLDKFDEINKSNTPEGQARRQLLEAAAQKLKEHPDDKEQQQQMKRDAAVFARDANINNRFDTQIQMTANDMTAANMLDTVAHNKDAFPNGVEAAYDSQMTTNTDAVMTATSEKREKALATIDEVDRKSAAALRAGSYGVQAAQMFNHQWEQESFGDLEKIQEHAKDARDHSISDITSGRIQEFEKEPKENKSLNKMNNYVADRLPEDYVPVRAEEKTTPQSPSQRETDKNEPTEPSHTHTKQGVKDYAENGSTTPPVVPTVGLENNGGKSETVRDEAVLQQNNDARITETRTTISDKRADLQAREAQHEERGNVLQDRIARIKSRAQKSAKTQETGDYMVDTMLAEGNISKEQEDALLNAGINEKKGKGQTSEERVLDHMIQSGKFSEKQLDIALTAAIERQRYTKG